jgi:hypothetical protein
MTRILTITAIAAAFAVVALSAVPSATATTEPGYQFIVAFHLENTGIVVKGPSSAPRGDAVQFLIVNQSTQRRRFWLGGRETKLLEPRQQYVFYIGFPDRGAFPYRSFGPHVKTFHGVFTID